MSTRAARRQVLVTVIALATIRSTAPLGIGSFGRLVEAVGDGVRSIEIIAPEIVFVYQLNVWDPLLIKSTIGAKLSGNLNTRLFYLHNGSKLSLHGVRIDGGIYDARRDSGSCPECEDIIYGGAIFADAGSELYLHSAHLSNNRAKSAGGAIYARQSNVTAAQCTMTSNSAYEGGAVYDSGGSTITITNSTMALNSAGTRGGAIEINEGSAVTLTDCTIASNFATWGGAAVVNGQMIVSGCMITSNRASYAGSMFVSSDGRVDLINSVFQSNVDRNVDRQGMGESVAIMNMDGYIQCDAVVGCLPVCTLCENDTEDAPSAITQQPTQQPVVQNHKKLGGLSAASVVGLLAVCLFGSLGVVFVGWQCRNSKIRAGQPGNGDTEMVQVELLQLMANLEQSPATTTTTGDNKSPSSSANDHATTSRLNEEQEQAGNRASLAWSAIGQSPAPIFAVDSEMRIVAWSQGAFCVTRARGAVLVRSLIQYGYRWLAPSNRDDRLSPADHESLRSASGGASLYACACERSMPQWYSPGFVRHDG